MSQSARREVEAASAQHHPTYAPSEETVGVDAFLAENPALPTHLAGVWEGSERETTERPDRGSTGGDDLSALFMGGSEARAAAEAQGLSVEGSLPTLGLPPSDFSETDYISFDTDDNWGREGAAPNPAVRWTVGREDPPPAAPPIDTHQAIRDSGGVIVSSLQGDRFIPTVQQQQSSLAPRQTSPVVLPKARNEPPAPRTSIYDHILSED